MKACEGDNAGHAAPVDIWAVGVCLWVLLCEAWPWGIGDNANATPLELQEMRMRIKTCSPLVTGGVKKAMEKRLLSVPQLDLLFHGLLALDPKVRWTADCALASPWFSDMK